MPSNRLGREAYRDTAIRVAQWSEAAGCEAILIGTDNGLVDPWVTAQVIIENTQTICPLVAAQPAYMHPFWVAKRIATLGYLYGRRVFLNLVAGGFPGDLAALGDETPHDERFDRAVEYGTIIRLLLESVKPVSFEGEFYQIHNPRMTPTLDPHLLPQLTISGSSPAAHVAAHRLEATLLQYPLPAHRYPDDVLPTVDVELGMRIGIIAREDGDEAWRVARQRFPEDRRGQLAHRLAAVASDSHWVRQLSEEGAETREELDPYWLGPFNNYQEFCPYLVGSYDTVAREIAGYQEAGFTTFLLDVPDEPEALRHATSVFSVATQPRVPGCPTDRSPGLSGPEAYPVM